MITDTSFLESGFSEEFSSFDKPVVIEEEEIIQESTNTVDDNIEDIAIQETRQEEPHGADIKRNIDEVRDTDIFFNTLEIRKDLDGDGNFFVDDVIGKEVKDGIGTIYGTTPDNTLLYDGAFDQYLRSQMDNELRLQEAMIGYITEAGENGTDDTKTAGDQQPAQRQNANQNNNNGNQNNQKVVKTSNRRLQDVVARKWDAFCKFIDGIIDRFWAAIDKILNTQKNYLEKYKDIILKKPPRENIEYEYTGDYQEGMDRCLNTKLPAFNYERDAGFLRQDGFEAAVKDFMSGKNFNYNKDEDLAVQFKNWFIAAERGQTKGKLANLNIKAIYNFCYDTRPMQNAVKADRSNLQQTRNQLINAVNKEMREKGENPNNSQVTNTATNSTGSDAAAKVTSTNTVTNTKESALDWVNLNEANENGGNPAGGETPQAGKTNMKITDNGAEKKDANGNVTKDGDNKAAGKTNTTEQDIINIVNKWTNISRSFCTGKLTAIQQISKDYMNLIKTHVRSYGGKGTDGGNNNNQNQNNQQNNANQQQQQNQG